MTCGAWLWHLDEEPCAGLVGNALAFVVYVLVPAAAVVAIVAAVVDLQLSLGCLWLWLQLRKRGSRW